MTQQAGWPRVAVVGAGAVGGYFGGLLARAGAPVVLIGRPPFVDAVQAQGLRLETLNFDEIVPVEASTQLSAARGADLVLFCVKTTDTAAAAAALAPHLSRQAQVVSLQNGVDNADQIRAASGLVARPAVVYVAASLPAAGHVKHVGRGDLVIGQGQPQCEELAATFCRAGIACRVSDNLVGDAWAKFLCNCALNGISAISRVPYGQIAENAAARALVAVLVAEILAVARAKGVVIPGIGDDAAGLAAALRLCAQVPGALSSTAQDLIRGKPTEIDSFNGYIVRRGAALGIPTPANEALCTLVKLAETRSP